MKFSKASLNCLLHRADITTKGMLAVVRNENLPGRRLFLQSVPAKPIRVDFPPKMKFSTGYSRRDVFTEQKYRFYLPSGYVVGFRASRSGQETKKPNDWTIHRLRLSLRRKHAIRRVTHFSTMNSWLEFSSNLYTCPAETRLKNESRENLYTKFFRTEILFVQNSL